MGWSAKADKREIKNADIGKFVSIGQCDISSERNFRDVREKRVREIGRARRWEEKGDGCKRDAMRALLVSSVDRKPTAEY